MQYDKSRSPRKIFVLAISLITLSARALAQQPVPTKPSEPGDDVIRVNTELVQTDVTVLDKKGRVVTGLKPEQFELRVNSKPQALSFVEEIVTGSTAEENQLKAAREGRPSITSPLTTAAESDQGQLIFFFVDDVHLAGQSWSRARSLLLDFLHMMKPSDRVAIVSTSGQVGFLQQLTNNQAVLRAAISRLKPKYNPETTASKVTISEADANMVANHSDRGLFAYLVAATMREYQMQNPINAVMMVKNRVSQINQQGKTAELATFAALENLIRSTAPLGGRKLVFFISDGFIADIKRSNGAEVIQRIGREAAGVGAVIYALDTRATFFGPGADVSRNDYPDDTGGTAWRSIVESKAPQEPLEALADETGGHSYLNANALLEGINEALAENSTYYLLGWRPDSEKQRTGRSDMQLTVKERPDLKVRTRRHHFDLKTVQSAKPLSGPPNSAEDELKAALGSLYPRRDIPSSVAANVNLAPKGPILNVSMQIDGSNLAFSFADGKQVAIVDVLGVAIDDRGVCSTFRQKLDVPREVLAGNRLVKWSQSLPLPPGIYQVRVAVRDRQSGSTGSAMTWIEVTRLELAPAKSQ